MYVARDISFSAGGKSILHEANLSVIPGLFTAIVGPNGAGKSSLLKVMANEHRQYSGEITINGRPIIQYTPKELSHVRAVMTQHSTLQFAFSVEHVVMLGRYACNKSTKEHSRIVDEVMAHTGTEALRGRNYLTLSGGEKQRVQLARALAQVWDETVHPRYLLLDEPTASMDIAQQQFMFALARRICERNIGVMAIVHDLNLAVQFSDMLCFLRGGKIMASGKTEEVFTKANIEETFCCKVNVYRDPCNACPFVIPDRVLTPASIAVSQ